jgi:hypothetical protein
VAARQLLTHVVPSEEMERKWAPNNVMMEIWFQEMAEAACALLRLGILVQVDLQVLLTHETLSEEIQRR